MPHATRYRNESFLIIPREIRRFRKAGTSDGAVRRGPLFPLHCDAGVSGFGGQYPVPDSVGVPTGLTVPFLWPALEILIQSVEGQLPLEGGDFR